MSDERKCSYCGKPEEITLVPVPPWTLNRDASGKVESATFTPKKPIRRTNLSGIIRGLMTCRECAKVVDKAARNRNHSIKVLTGKPLAGEQWGKFLESRKA